ncbi:hypothetical protein D3C78_1915690 [compost metagenome]
MAAMRSPFSSMRNRPGLPRRRALMMFMLLLLAVGFAHAPYQHGDRSIHAKKRVIDGLPAQLFDALDALIDGVAVQP